MAVKLATNVSSNIRERVLIKQAKRRCKFLGVSFRKSGMIEPTVSLKCKSSLVSKIFLKFEDYFSFSSFNMNNKMWC